MIPIAVEKWKGDYNMNFKKSQKLTDEKGKAYMIIWGQCDDEIRNKIEAHSNHKIIDEDQNLMELVKVLEGTCCSFETTTQ